MTYLKQANAAIKAVGPGDDNDLAEGEFLALVSVFNVVDTYGDVVLPGAFTDTLAKHAASGDPIPVVWSHQWTDPFSHIGHVVKAEEIVEGLLVRGALDLENPTATQVHKLLKARRVRQFSFGFDVDDGGWGERDDSEVYELRKLTLHEVGPCLLGVNRQTELRDVKGTPPSSRRDKTPPERKGDEGSAAPLITADALGAWAFTNNPEGSNA
ncbi:HK97 family phage prohead protease [Cellulosimicrobium sp. CpK407]|uniref:HK97 family phage prohead protease n=1 Tax=Cellulosimicrobium sp. CpK407 TaxID=3229847 RepID=UPI003F2CFE2E